MFALKLDFLAFASIEGKSSKKPSIELKRQTDQETLWKIPLCVISHVDQQSSRIGRKMSHVYCIVRTQDSYVLSRGQAIWKSVAKNLDFFWLLTYIIIIIIIIIMLSIKGPILTSLTCIFLRRWPTDIMTTQWQPFILFMADLLHAFSWNFRATVVKRYKQNFSTSALL